MALITEHPVQGNGNTPARKLDFFISVCNRANLLHDYLKSGLAMNVDGVHFIVFDDASNEKEEIPNICPMSVEEVCHSFKDDRIIYIKNSENHGFAANLTTYYNKYCEAEYVALQNPKDVFINRAPVAEALQKLDADHAISMIVYPLLREDRKEECGEIGFNYPRMSGVDFIASHVRDPMLQHAASYAIMRVSALRKVGGPHDMRLRDLGLEDGSGIDHDVIFNVATTGDVDFMSTPVLHISTLGGFTERYPLTFAYCQYQYARRLMQQLEPKGLVSPDTRRIYIGLWHLLISRGIVVAYRPVHGTEGEKGVERIRPHLSLPILLYLPLECLRFRVIPSRETIDTYLLGARLLLKDWKAKLSARWGFPSRND